MPKPRNSGSQGNLQTSPSSGLRQLTFTLAFYLSLLTLFSFWDLQGITSVHSQHYGSPQHWGRQTNSPACADSNDVLWNMALQCCPTAPAGWERFLCLTWLGAGCYPWHAGPHLPNFWTPGHMHGSTLQAGWPFLTATLWGELLVTPDRLESLSFFLWPHPTTETAKKKLYSASGLWIPNYIPFLTHIFNPRTPSPRCGPQQRLKNKQLFNI